MGSCEDQQDGLVASHGANDMMRMMKVRTRQRSQYDAIEKEIIRMYLDGKDAPLQLRLVYRDETLGQAWRENFGTQPNV